MALLPSVMLETRPEPDAAIIWLHGLGADGNDFVPVVPQLNLPTDLGIRFIFPHAPAIAVSVNGGFVMPAWYDIRHMDIDREIDFEQLLRSADSITALVNDQQQQGIAANRIIVAGFSQGGAVAYQVALSHPDSLAGLLTLSSYFATHTSINMHQANQNLPILVQHGTLDPVVPESLGKEAEALLTARGYRVTYRTYQMEHTLCLQQLGDICQWLQVVLG